MKTLTIKNLDERILAKLRAQAKKHGRSLSAHVRQVLAVSVGAARGPEAHDDLAGLARVWSKEDAMEFEENTRAFGKIDDELWR